jgi:hypothetical protein
VASQLSRTKLVWLRAVACATFCAAMPSALSNAAAPAVSEHEVKAAIVYRVAKFIDWPAQSFADAQAFFEICVVGSAGVLQAFEPLNGRTLNGHPVAVRRVTGDMLDLQRCHAAYFPADAEGDVDYALSKLRALPVLTVGEGEHFARRGGILALTMRDQRVRFALNLRTSKQAGLTVSAQLLQLADVVGHAP